MHEFRRIFAVDAGFGAVWEDPEGNISPAPSRLKDASVGEIYAIRGISIAAAPPVYWKPLVRSGRVLLVDGSVVVATDGQQFAHLAIGDELSCVVGDFVSYNSRHEVLEVHPFETKSDEPGISARRVDANDGFLPKARAVDSSLTWADFCGFPDIVSQARQFVEIDILKRTEFDRFGHRPATGAIFSGPPGTGKTLMAEIMAVASGANFFSLSAADLGGRLVAESDIRLGQVYDAALACEGASIIFLDEIDAVAQSRDSTRHGTDRIVSTLLVRMDGIQRSGGKVFTLAATNKPELIDDALMRSGRFGAQLHFRRPESASQRLKILERGRDKSGELVDSAVDLEYAARRSDGMSAADLAEVWSIAVRMAVATGRDKIYEDQFSAALVEVEGRNEVR